MDAEAGDHRQLQFDNKYNTTIDQSELDEISAREKAINDWVPIVAPSRTVKWWHSTIHMVTIIVGTGVLGLPHAMAQMGWGPGTSFLVVSWVVTLFSLWQMVNMHDMVPGKRFDRLHELGQHAFGKRLGLWIVLPEQLIGIIAVDIVYMVTGGQCLKKFYDLVCEDCKDIRRIYFTMIIAFVHFALSLLPNFNSIAGISLAAAIMSLSYSTIAWGGSIHKGVQPDVQYVAGNVFDFFSALGSVLFAYSNSIVMEIQATIPSTPEKPSRGPMWRGVVVAYAIVAACYFPVALIGYRMFGNQVEENILITLEKPNWLIAMANMFVVVHLIGSYQVYAMAVFNMMETVLVKKLKLRETWYLRLVTRHTYVALTTFIAISFPFFGGILGSIGGFSAAPTIYIFPSAIWLATRRPRRFSLSWSARWVCIMFGVVLTVVGTIGGLRQIIVHAKHYNFYS